MEKKKTKKKWREIRSAVTMMCVMAAMMSTATFAWFSLTSNPVVTGLEMTAVASDGLWISKDGTTWFNAIDMGVENGKDNVEALEKFVLQPVTLTDATYSETDGLSFGVPKYNGNNVDSVTALKEIVDGNKNTDFNNYVATCEYYLKSTGQNSVDVGILTRNPGDTELDKNNIGVTTEGMPNEEGSFVVLTEAPDGDSATDASAVNAVRVAFVVEQESGTVVKVWEPNYTNTNFVAGSTYATDSLNDSNVSPNVVSTYDDGTITKGYLTDSGDTKSEKLFTVDTDGTLVKMYVWFEGQDNQCVDQIMEDLIETQIQFTVVSSSNT